MKQGKLQWIPMTSPLQDAVFSMGTEQRKSNIPHAAIFFWIGNMFLWFNNLLSHPSYHHHFPQDIIIHLSCPPQENITPKWCSLLKVPQLLDIKKGEKQFYSTEKLPGRKGCRSRLYIMCCVSSGSAGSSFFRSFWNGIFPPFLIWIKLCT